MTFTAEEINAATAHTNLSGEPDFLPLLDAFEASEMGQVIHANHAPVTHEDRVLFATIF